MTAGFCLLCVMVARGQSRILGQWLAVARELAQFRGLDARDVDFMERLQGLAAEVLALPNLTAHQRLIWATSMRLDAVPVQERGLAARLQRRFDLVAFFGLFRGRVARAVAWPKCGTLSFTHLFNCGQGWVDT